MTKSPTPVGGAVEVVAAALDAGLQAVAGVHTAIARKPFAALRPVPAVGTVAALVQAIHDGVTGAVYAGLGAGLTLMGGAAGLAAAAAGGEREPRAGSLSDTAQAALNGFAGDRLERAGNPLAAAMSLRHRGRPLAPQRDALAAAHPRASGRLVLFVHGLACNENVWRGALRKQGGSRIDYGAQLQRELDCTALYVRYNSGLPIAENGRRLARLFDEVVAEWPRPIEELVLVGHSMGGLVLRSAAHHAGDAAWTSRVRHVFYLGAPHRGAPLEKAANVAGWLLALSDVTRPFAALLNRRSRGIKDLRFGAVRDEDWGGDIDALLDDRTADLPLLDGANHYFIAATVTRDRNHPLAHVVGDLLVRPASALGRPSHVRFPLARARHFGAMHHLALLDHPAVYEQIRHALSPPAPA